MERSGGAAAIAVLGFTLFGWTTGGTAARLAEARAESAVVAALAPICAEKFQRDAEASTNIAKLKQISSTWEQGNFIEKGGWAMMPGETSSDYRRTRACADILNGKAGLGS